MTDRQAAQGEFERLFNEHYGELVRFASARVSSAAAQDIVAEVFTITWRRWREVPADSRRAWLYGVTRRVVANELRRMARQSRLRDVLGRDREPHAGDVSEVPAEHRLVHAGLARLNDRDVEVLRLVLWEELDAATAAAALGCTQAALRVRLHRARRRLAQAMTAVSADMTTSLTAERERR